MFKLVLGEERTYFAETRRNRKLPRIILPLRGIFKGETGETLHFVVVTAKSDSSLSIGSWMEREIASRERRGLAQGYLFVNSSGGMIRSKDLEVDILDWIALIQKEHPDLIRPGLDVHEEYGLSRSPRRGSNSEAQNRGVEDGDIDRSNLWKKVDRAGARKVKLRMSDHYTDLLVSLESFLRYSQAL